MAIVSTRPGIIVRFPVRFPARVTASAPLVLTQTGAAYALSIDLTALANSLPSLELHVAQVIAQLVALGSFDTIANVMPPSPVAPETVIWNRGGVTQPTGPLMTLIFSTLGIVTQPNKDAFVAAAKLLPY